MINVIKDPINNTFDVWTDTEDGERDGRCIGTDRSLEEALRQAYHELSEDLSAIEKRLSELGCEHD